MRRNTAELNKYVTSTRFGGRSPSTVSVVHTCIHSTAYRKYDSSDDRNDTIRRTVGTGLDYVVYLYVSIYHVLAQQSFYYFVATSTV